MFAGKGFLIFLVIMYHYEASEPSLPFLHLGDSSSFADLKNSGSVPDVFSLCLSVYIENAQDTFFMEVGKIKFQYDGVRFGY